MIHFTLKCANDHRFDSWFQSSAAFEKLLTAGMVTCAVCGSDQVEKAIMAPRIHDSRGRATEPTNDVPEAPSKTPLSAPRSAAEQAIAELRKKVETESEYVGLNFAQEARDMHAGDTPERSIYGEARPEDAAELIEEGIPVTPLPFVPGRKTN